MAKDAYYFPHDSNAKDDPKCVLLIEELQLEGYGIYWILIETLREQPDFKYPMKLIPALARRYFTSKEKMTAVIKGYGLFKIEGDEFFYSESLMRRMEIVNEKREKAKIAGIKSGEARRAKALTIKEIMNDEQTMNGCSTDVEQNTNNKSKENKNKENKNKENKNKEKYIYVFNNPSTDFEKAFTDFENFRIEMGKPMTEKAKNLILDKLDKLAKTDAEKIEILNQSIMLNWTGVFEIKGKSKTAVIPKDDDKYSVPYASKDIAKYLTY